MSAIAADAVPNTIMNLGAWLMTAGVKGDLAGRSSCRHTTSQSRTSTSCPGRPPEPLPNAETMADGKARAAPPPQIHAFSEP